MKTIEQLRYETYIDLKNKLNVFHRCALIRPCGWGKTIMVVNRLLKDYERILFLYPSQGISTMLEYRYEDVSDEKFTRISYNKLARMTPEEIKNLPDYDLVFADEAHCLGGEKVKASFRILLDTQGENTAFVGSTATPLRMDGFDFVESLFDGIVVEPYTLHDAIFHDKIIKKPIYRFCVLNPKEDFADGVKKILKYEFNRSITNKEIEELLKGDILENLNIYRVENVIKKACTKALSDTTYMKFICFCTRIKNIKDSYKMIVNWFENAFPDYRIRKTEVHSGKGAKSVQHMEQLVEEDHTIDLIFTCDMLNEGYHVDNLTGIVMLRKTASSRVYNQQLGRCLSTNKNDSQKVIIDVVDNIHRHSAFHDFEEDNISGGIDIIPIKGSDDDSDLPGGDDDNDGDGVSTGGKESGRKTTGKSDKDDSSPTFVTGAGWYNDANSLRRTDVEADDYGASMYEFERKTVFEHILQSDIDEALAIFEKALCSVGADARKGKAWKDFYTSVIRTVANRKGKNIPEKILYAAFESKHFELKE